VIIGVPGRGEVNQRRIPPGWRRQRPQKSPSRRRIGRSADRRKGCPAADSCAAEHRRDGGEPQFLAYAYASCRMLGCIRDESGFGTRSRAGPLGRQWHAIAPRGSHMDQDSAQPPLVRRVPGANLRLRAVPPACPPVLSDAVVQRVQAAVDAERASPEQPAGSAGPQQQRPDAAGESNRGTRRSPRPLARTAKRKRDSHLGS
jgi:hypothetical protein